MSTRIILHREYTTISIYDIAVSYKDSITEGYYRKPWHQRNLKRNLEWNKNLINSIFKNRHIGEMVVSKHFEMVDDEPHEYYDVEDGQTRMNAIKSYMNGDFEVDGYGYYNDNTEEFGKYTVSILKLSKARGQGTISNEEFIKELNLNFRLLQECQSLKPNDLYWATKSHNGHKGSDLVDTGIKRIEDETYKNKPDVFQSCIGIKHITNKNRTGLSELVATVSGIMYGPDYLTKNYRDHVHLLHKNITEDLHKKFDDTINAFNSIVEETYINNPIEKGEHKPQLFKLTAFTSLILCDIYGNDFHSESFNALKKFWVKVLNLYRRKIKELTEKKAKIWWESTVYSSLTNAQKRNLFKKDLTAKINSIRSYWYNLSQSNSYAV